MSTSVGALRNEVSDVVPFATDSRSQLTARPQQYEDSLRYFKQILLCESIFADCRESALVGHCLPTQACHADGIIAECTATFPLAYDRYNRDGTVASPAVLNNLTQPRLSPQSDDGSSPDEGAPPRGAAWGVGKPTARGIKVHSLQHL